MPQTVKKTIQWTALFLLLSLTALAAGQVYNFKGGVKTRADKGLTAAQIRPTQNPDNWFFTWCYTFILYMDDGSSSTIQFTYWKAYITDRYGVVFSFIDKGEKQTLGNGIFETEQMKWTDHPPQLAMGPNYFTAAHPDYKIHLDLPATDEAPAMKADLAIKSRVPGWRPGEGPVHYGEPDGPWYDLVVPIPWGDLSGTVTIGGKVKKVTGWGYSDHNSQTVLPTEQLGKILALRSFDKEHAINFLEYIAPEKYGQTRSTWLIAMKGDRILFATDKWSRELKDLKTEPKTGYQYPTRVLVKFDDPAIKLEGEIKGVRLIEIIEPLKEIPDWVKSFAERFFEAPAFIRQNVTVEWRLTMPQEGIDEKFTCAGVFETTIVK